MKIHEATEQAYKNGYEKGKQDAVKHGRWEKASETMPIYRCSICKERNLFKNGNNALSNYCPNCGARMDGDGQ